MVSVKKQANNFSNAAQGFEVFINDHFVFDDNDDHEPQMDSA